MSTKKDALERAVSIVDGQAELARRVIRCGRKISQQSIALWLAKGVGVPVGWGIWIARAVEFRVSPHELDPVTYPNAWDGLPLDRARPLIEEKLAA